LLGPRRGKEGGGGTQRASFGGEEDRREKGLIFVSLPVDSSTVEKKKDARRSYDLRRRPGHTGASCTAIIPTVSNWGGGKGEEAVSRCFGGLKGTKKKGLPGDPSKTNFAEKKGK